MSFACLILAGLLFASPFYDAANIKDKSLEGGGRQRCALIDIQSMIDTLTDRKSGDFLNYGNFCGYEGSGDPIDECCQAHDNCFGDITKGACPQYGREADYKLRKADDGTVVSEENENKCQIAICMCGAVLVNCIQKNINSYNVAKYNKSMWNFPDKK